MRELTPEERAELVQDLEERVTEAARQGAASRIAEERALLHYREAVSRTLHYEAEEEQAVEALMNARGY